MNTIQKVNLNSYIEQLILIYPQIKSVWLIGSRANNSFSENSDWDLLAFADEQTLNQLGQNAKFKHDCIDLLVVYDHNHFRKPWTDSARGENLKSGSLKKWKWRELNSELAQYESSDEKIFYDSYDEGIYTPKSKVLKAHKIWPIVTIKVSN
ncbi:MAG TPA: hypothetical protein DD723_07805 [Candidatus Omnitrophica bacterium]|nr:MAG: hypothetical protein A2Z81_04205 [Omnitrophica WOR_2 bacterium GWA2_45_18]HBR15430.1 hypothetical protein [Candidatus Omnitrophota bacterium]